MTALLGLGCWRTVSSRTSPHLDDHAAYALGGDPADLERDVRPQRGAEDRRLVEREAVEQSDDLPGEDRHRIAPRLGRAL
jgi:hypothetical protein